MSCMSASSSIMDASICYMSSSEEDLRTPFKINSTQHNRDELRVKPMMHSSVSCQKLKHSPGLSLTPSSSTNFDSTRKGSFCSFDFNQTCYSVDEHRNEEDNCFNQTVCCTPSSNQQKDLSDWLHRKSNLASNLKHRSSIALTSIRTHLTPKRPARGRRSETSISTSVRSSLFAESHWSDSLESVLADPEGRVCFSEFLKKEFSDENLQFWQEVQSLKEISSKSKTKQKIKQIYLTFVIDDAPKLLNLTMPVRLSVASNVIKNPTDKNCFEKAEESIFQLMKNDSFRRFKSSLAVR